MTSSGSVLPVWIRSLRPLAESVAGAGGPRRWVVSVLLGAVASAWLAGVRTVGGAILAAGTVVGDAIAAVRAGLAAPGAAVEWVVTQIVLAVVDVLGAAVQPLGPAAPAAVAFLWALVAFGTVWAGLKLIGVIL